LSQLIGGPETPSATVGAWAWEFIHGTVPSRRGPARFGGLDMVSFVVSLYFFVATLFSLVATLLAQAIMRVHEQQS
jgi:hypothetical protein